MENSIIPCMLIIQKISLKQRQGTDIQSKITPSTSIIRVEDISTLLMEARVPPKHQYMSAKLHSVTSHRTVILVFTTVRSLISHWP